MNLVSNHILKGTGKVLSEDVDVTIVFRHYIAEKTMSDESTPVGMMNEFAHGSGWSPRYEEVATGQSRKPIFTVQVDKVNALIRSSCSGIVT